MTKVYTLKSGKTYTAPSLFVNPQHILDVKALWYTDDNYGLPHIDGIYLRLLNYKKIFPSLALNAQSLIPSDRPTLREKIIIIANVAFLFDSSNENNFLILFFSLNGILFFANNT